MRNRIPEAETRIGKLARAIAIDVIKKIGEEEVNNVCNLLNVIDKRTADRRRGSRSESVNWSAGGELACCE